MSADETSEVGKITKQWMGLMELFTDADNFSVTCKLNFVILTVSLEYIVRSCPLRENVKSFPETRVFTVLFQKHSPKVRRETHEQNNKTIVCMACRHRYQITK